MTTTLDGYEPRIGDLVWQQMYMPTEPAPDSPIQERVAHGKTYGPRRQMVVRNVTPDYDANGYARSLGADLDPRTVTRWTLQDPDPRRRRDECRGYSWVESDWCVLELVDPFATTDEGMLL